MFFLIFCISYIPPRFRQQSITYQSFLYEYLIQMNIRLQKVTEHFQKKKHNVYFLMTYFL